MNPEYEKRLLKRKFIDSIVNQWLAEFDENDPSMAALGKNAWLAQCIVAAAELDKEVQKVIVSVTERLVVDGEFYKGPGV